MLTFYPPAYKQGKTCGLIVFNPGDGENTSLDITQVLYNSLAKKIQAGWTPYSILPNKDTLFWVVTVLHSNAGSAYRTQQAQILPWILDKSGIRYDPKRVWISGLSGGGSATWASIMIDTTLAKRITGIIPMANGGYDLQLSILMNNLVTACKNGLYFFPFIGTQDPGYNATGFFAYDAVLKTWCLPDCYHPHIIINGKHDASVWDVPWNTQSVMDSLGIIGYVTPSVPTDIPVHAKILQDSTQINYPNTAVYLYDSSSSGSGRLLNTQWFIAASPTGLAPLLYHMPSGALWASRLIPGITKIGLRAFDSATNFVDTAYAYIKVNGPVPIPCPLCPPLRKCIGFTLDAITGKFLFTYDDGNP